MNFLLSRAAYAEYANNRRVQLCTERRLDLLLTTTIPVVQKKSHVENVYVGCFAVVVTKYWLTGKTAFNYFNRLFVIWKLH